MIEIFQRLNFVCCHFDIFHSFFLSLCGIYSGCYRRCSLFSEHCSLFRRRFFYCTFCVSFDGYICPFLFEIVMWISRKGINSHRLNKTDNDKYVLFNVSKHQNFQFFYRKQRFYFMTFWDALIYIIFQKHKSHKDNVIKNGVSDSEVPFSKRQKGMATTTSSNVWMRLNSEHSNTLEFWH